MQNNGLEYVAFWPRVGAYVIDLILVFIVTWPLLVSIYGMGYFTNPNNPLIMGPADFVISWIFPAVAVINFWLYKQATPGKMAVGARVVDANTGQTMTTLQAVGRYFAYLASLLPLGFGFIWIAFDPRRQAWHDKLAGTVVVRSQHRGAEKVSFNDQAPFRDRSTNSSSGSNWSELRQDKGPD